MSPIWRRSFGSVLNPGPITSRCRFSPGWKRSGRKIRRDSLALDDIAKTDRRWRCTTWSPPVAGRLPPVVPGTPAVTPGSGCRGPGPLRQTRNRRRERQPRTPGFAWSLTMNTRMWPAERRCHCYADFRCVARGTQLQVLDCLLWAALRYADRTQLCRDHRQEGRIKERDRRAAGALAGGGSGRSASTSTGSRFEEFTREPGRGDAGSRRSSLVRTGAYLIPGW